MNLDPGTPAYEVARGRLVAELQRIGRTEPRSGYLEMADDLKDGQLMEVPTWVVLQLMARGT